MTDREKVIKGLRLCGYQEGMPQCDSCPYDGKNCWARLKRDALFLLKEQKSIKHKMWNALYAEEDKLEKYYAGTDNYDDWFSVYRPWLQRGFEIAIEVIAKQEGR